MGYKEEFVVIDKTEPVRQGDLFRFGQTYFNKPDRWGVIITADCDIAQNKIGDYYTYCPIITAEYYIKAIWSRDIILKMQHKFVGDAINAIYKLHFLFDKSAIKLTSAGLIDWLMDSDNDTILRSLRCQDVKVRKRVSMLLDGVRLSVLPGDFPLEKAFERLCKIWNEYDKRGKNSQRSGIINALKDLRIEYFFINFLPEEEDFGYIALLRDVRPIARAQFFTNRIDAKFTRREPPYAFRLGRLNDYLKYALTQQFATLFARIGLPAEYEGDRNEIIESLCAQCVPIDEKA